MTNVARRDDRFVYFIQAGEDGPIKIGSAVDPIVRLKKSSRSATRSRSAYS